MGVVGQAPENAPRSTGDDREPGIRLRDFYEIPTVPVRSGQLRTRRLLHLLEGILRTSQPVSRQVSPAGPSTGRSSSSTSAAATACAPN
jgi:hypothetical protein